MFLVSLALASQVCGMPFKHFVTRFRKTYSSESDQEAHRLIYNKNLALIDAHNQLFEAGKVSWAKGINQFTDMTAEEFSVFNGFRHKKSDDQPCDDAVFDYSQPLPDTVDYRQADPAVLSPVKDQGSCGSCWAFAVTETVEAAVAIASKQAPPVLSPQEVVSCTPNPDKCGGTGGCQGATEELGYGQVAKTGLCTNADWPYTATNGECDNPCKPVVNITGCAKLATNNGTDLMYAVAQKGPIAVTVDASRWSAYKSGVYTGCLDERFYDLDHGVQLVGYGSENGQNYWIIRNSWGSSWGENGYIRIGRLDPSDPDACKADVTPGNGVACDGDRDPITVCGECGMWYDTSYPVGATYIN